MRFTVPVELGDIVVIRSTGEQAEVLGVKYENGSIDNIFFMDCFSIYTDRGIFALQELAKVTSHTEADNYVDEHSV